MILRLLALALAVALAASACGTEDACAKITCSPGRSCVPETGVCQATDAGL